MVVARASKTSSASELSSSRRSSWRNFLCRNCCDDQEPKEVPQSLIKLYSYDHEPVDQVDEDRPRSYICRTDAQLIGDPIRVDSLCHVSTSDPRLKETTVKLFVNGLEYWQNGRPWEVSFSPFILVRDCTLIRDDINPNPLQFVKIFKIIFHKGESLFFAVTGQSDEEVTEKRFSWTRAITNCVLTMTRSIFPRYHTIRMTPTPNRPLTEGRLLAGYLLLLQEGSTYSSEHSTIHVIYADVGFIEHCHAAQICFYQDHTCSLPLHTIDIRHITFCEEKHGIQCTCFTVQGLLFSTKSMWERELWFRTLNNIRVKLLGSWYELEEQLPLFRRAILEHSDVLKSSVRENVSDLMLLEAAPTDTIVFRPPAGSQQFAAPTNSNFVNTAASLNPGASKPVPIKIGSAVSDDDPKSLDGHDGISVGISSTENLRKNDDEPLERELNSPPPSPERSECCAAANAKKATETDFSQRNWSLGEKDVIKEEDSSVVPDHALL